ncbi:MAG: hypothetical protein L3J67_05970 [Hyphomicrobiaceae bacterium]|nr:hypothetical protein [Hyphomicrobiaceae bacterium]
MDAQTEFWSWFASQAKGFRTAPQEEMTLIVQHISERIKLVNEALVCEFGLKGEQLGELVISGDGIKEHMPAVSSFVEAAPKIEGWTITAFRPRLDQYEEMELTFSGQLISPKTIWFRPLTDEGEFDVIFYHFDFDKDDSNSLINGTYILLDMAIGELDVMTKIRYMDHELIEGDPGEQGLLAFSEFRTVFDEFYKGRSL